MDLPRKKVPLAVLFKLVQIGESGLCTVLAEAAPTGSQAEFLTAGNSPRLGGLPPGPAANTAGPPSIWVGVYFLCGDTPGQGTVFS